MSSPSPASSAVREPRVVCAGCGRPASVCLCSAIVRVPTRTRVVILQHPRESAVPIGTARLAELGLPNAERHVAVDFSASARVRQILADRAAPPILLFPGQGARDLEHDLPEGPVTLVVLDGTWWQARKLLKKNPALAALPRYGFEPAIPSRYRIRREPASHCVSTIEAIVHALSRLERDTPGLTGLLAPFEAMVDRQLGYASNSRAARHRTKAHTRRAFGWPAALAECAADLVVGYAEANAWPRGTPFGPHPELVHIVVERVLGGERFEAFVAPRLPLAPSFTLHTELAPERVLGGEAWPAFAARWQAFLRPGDVLGSWGWYWSEILRRDGAAVPERVDLRAVAQRWLRDRPVERSAEGGRREQVERSAEGGRREHVERSAEGGRGEPGDVEACARRLGESFVPWAAGRTGRRAAALAAVARGLLAAAAAQDG